VWFLWDEVAVTLWDEDSPGGKAYTRSILLQGYAESAEAFLVSRLYANIVFFDAYA
jgi:hypothetical protein